MNEPAWAAFWIGIAGFWIASRTLPRHIAAVVTLIKVSIPVVYFSWYYDGTWTFVDDETYAQQGTILLHSGYSPFSILLRPEGIDLLVSISGSRHILYEWWNFLGQYLFGSHYHAAVFLNVGLTFVCGHLFAQLLKRMKFGEQYVRWLQVFFLLHWDILAWSSLMNLKDILVTTLALGSLSSIEKFAERRSLSSLAVAGILLFLLSWIRYYLPFLILLSVALWVVFAIRSRLKYPVLCLLGGILYGSLYFLDVNEESISLDHLLFGLIRFALTPQPWSIEPGFSYLLIPSVMHWLLCIPSVIAACFLWRDSGKARLMLSYLMVILLFYAAVPEIQEPRHRIQVVFVIAWLQFHAIWSMAKVVLMRHRRPAVIQAAAT